MVSKPKRGKRSVGKRVPQPTEPATLAPIAEYHERKLAEARAIAGKNRGGRLLKVGAAKKKPAQQLDREIDEVLAKPSNGNGGMERVTRERVHEALIGEHVTRSEPVTITLLDAIGPEEWKLVFTKGRNYGGASAGRILISLGGVSDPLAGLAYAVEYGRPYVHHVWVDPDARGRGLSQVLFDAYRSEVSPNLIVVGPFTKAGRAAAERAGATLEE